MVGFWLCFEGGDDEVFLFIIWRCERKRRVKDDSKGLARATRRIEWPLTDIGKEMRGTALGKNISNSGLDMF